jgi:uncharacterized protein
MMETADRILMERKSLVMETTTALVIAPAKAAAYRSTALQRVEREKRALALRQERAWEVAGRAARLLKADYGVKRVVLFGSLARGQGFHSRSDIDLAVWELDERLLYRAASQLLDLEPGIEIDIVMTEEAPETLKRTIESEGITL